MSTIRQILSDGTSEGAELGWEHRKGGGAEEEVAIKEEGTKKEVMYQGQSFSAERSRGYARSHAQYTIKVGRDEKNFKLEPGVGNKVMKYLVKSGLKESIAKQLISKDDL